MTSVMADHRVDVRVRDATDLDNDALVRLAAACPMAGDITMCVERSPDFLALSRLEGTRCRVAVAVREDEVMGCAMAAERMAYVNGQSMATTYAGDLKVLPAHRGGPAADALVQYGRQACAEFAGEDVPILATVLAGNGTMERRVTGVRGLPVLTPIATLDVHAIPFVWRRSSAVQGIGVSEATEGDVGEMAELAARVSPMRQFAPTLDATALQAFIARAPGLAITDYLVARRADGRIAGFVAFWQQASFKQLRVVSYSARLRMARSAVNAIAPFVDGATLPRAGQLLGSFAAVHLTVRPDEPEVLHALLLYAYQKLRSSGALFYTIALDRRDPVRTAVSGLLAQPTTVRAFVTTPRGRWAGNSLDGRPLYFEAALV